MAKTQEQAFCNRCQEHTLHVRSVEPINHAIHWIMLLLLPRRTHPWVCSFCGERMGHVPKEVRRAIKEERRQAKEAKQVAREKEREARSVDHERQPKPEEIAEEEAERAADAERRREAREAAMASMKEGASKAAQGVWQQVKTAVLMVNSMLERVAGDEVALLRIYQALLALAGLLIMSTVTRSIATYLGLW